MAEVSVLNGYIIKDKKAIRYYNTVADMKVDTTLKENMHVKTSGYYAKNDGGCAEYLIRAKTNNDVEDSGIIHFIQNNLVAEMIIKDNTINFKQLGAKSEQDSNYQHIDNKVFLEKFLNIDNKNYKLYIPSGVWCFSETLINKSNKTIFGDNSFFINEKNSGTIITSVNNNQSYVWKIGGNINIDYQSTNVLHHINLDGLIFSSGVYSENAIAPSTLNSINNSALYVDSISFCDFGVLQFNYIYGTALTISSSWELYINRLNFRQIFNHNKPVMFFDKRHSVTGVSAPNISALDIINMMFESCNGNYIEFDIDSHFLNNHIHHINAECSFCNGYQENGSIANVSGTESYDIHESFMVGGQCGQLIIDAIDITLMGYYCHEINGQSYVIDNFIEHKTGTVESGSTPTNTGSYFRCNISTLDFDYNKKDITIIKQDTNIPISINNRIVINNLLQRSENAYHCKFDLNRYQGLYINNFIELPLGDSTILLNKNKIKNNPIYSCYNYAMNGSNNMCLVSDDDAINPLKICAKYYTDNANTKVLVIPNFIFTKIKIRIKIPNEDTAQIFYNNGTGYTGSFASVTGTGDFAWYEFDFTNLVNPEIQNMTLSCANANAIFDSMILIP